MSTVRAKFKCSSITSFDGGSKKVQMHAVYSKDPNNENKDFTDSSPSGSFEIGIAAGKPAGDLFEAGKEYYLDITEAVKVEPA